MSTCEAPLNDSKGCGGVMRVAPVGHVAAPGDVEGAFAEACAIAALTHGHPSGYLASGARAATIAELLRGRPLVEAAGSALEIVRRSSGSAEVAAAMASALRLAYDEVSVPRDAVAQLGAGWVAEEALAIHRPHGTGSSCAPRSARSHAHFA